MKEEKKERDYKKLIILLLLLLIFLLMSTTIGINIIHNKEKDSSLKLNDNRNENIKEEIKEETNEEVEELEDEETVDSKDEIIKEETTEEITKPYIKTSKIIVRDALVVLLIGEDYDLFKDIKIDTGRNLTIYSNVNSTKSLPVGIHKIIYTAKDINGVEITATRTIRVLNPLSDDDNDGYTNEEEINNNVDPLSDGKQPSYSTIPTLDITNCPTSMTVYNELPDFTSCISVKDNYYNVEGLSISIDKNNVDTKNIGKYPITIEVTDNLNNKVSKDIELEVGKRKVTVQIDDKTTSYSNELVELTSNATEVAVPSTDIKVELTTNATSTSDIGHYDIIGTWTNNNYDVTFINGKYTIVPLLLNELTEEEIKNKFNIIFNGLTTTYDKTEKSIKLEGTLPSDITVSYQNNTGTNANTYNAIAVLTGKNNYQGEHKLEATLTINKAIPTYEIPTNLTAEEDATLNDIVLPQGFTYQDDTTVSLAPGTYEVKLTYSPSDLVNYEIVKDIKTEIIITPAVYYTITFVDKDNNILSTQSVRKHRSAVEPNIEEEYDKNGKNYVFSGWIGNYIDVVDNATITPLYIEESTSTTFAYVLDAKYYQPQNGEGYSASYYTNALQAEDGSKIPLSIKIGGLTESQAESILNQETTIVALNETDIMKYLTQSTKDQLTNISHGQDELGAYTIEWYVLKYQPDGWHLDGYKVYDELTLDISYNSTTSKINLTFANAVENIEVTINNTEKTITNSSGNADIGNTYSISHALSTESKTIVIKYSFKNIDYTKEYLIQNETIILKQ